MSTEPDKSGADRVLIVDNGSSHAEEDVGQANAG
jgi:hypothetical protein